MAFVYWVHLPEQSDFTSQGYVGVTASTVNHRFAAHCKLSRKGSETHFHRALRKYGIESFVVDTLVEGSVEYCFMVENQLRPSPNLGLNMAIGGTISPMIGRGHSEATKGKISEKSKLHRHSDEAKAKIGDKHRGKKVSDATKALLSKCRLGVPITDEHKANISKAQMGRRNSPEAIAKTAAGLRGKPKTEAHKQAMSAARKGVPLSEEHCKRLSERAIEAGPWNNPKANKEVWQNAKDLFYLSQMYCVPYIERLTGFTKSNLTSISRKFEDGWVPEEDSKYLAWLEEYNKQKECPNGT